MKAVNLKEKLANARETCRGYSEYTYRFVDYVAEHLSGPVGPVGLAAAILDRLHEIESGCDRDGNALLPYFITNKDEILAVAWQFLQVIDVVTDDKFAEKFRELFDCVLDWDALKRLTVEDDCDYPDCIKVAIDWWTGAIQAGRAYTSPFNDSGHDGDTYKQLTAEEVKTFRKVLAEVLMEKMGRSDSVLMEVAPCYSPDTEMVWFGMHDSEPLKAAMEAVGLSYDAEDMNAVPPHHSFYDQDLLWMTIYEDHILLHQGCDPTFIWWKDE